MRFPEFVSAALAAARRKTSVIALALGSLATLALASCGSSQPAAPMSEEERIMRAETKSEEHRIFYEGWLHPGD